MRHLTPMVFLKNDVDKPFLQTSDSRLLFSIGKEIIKQCSHILTVLASSQSLDNHWRHASLAEACDKFINTRKHHPECFPKPKRLYPMLVTGLGGTGTHFIANSLQNLGFDLVHEGIGSEGAVVSFSDIATSTYITSVCFSPHHLHSPGCMRSTTI